MRVGIVGVMNLVKDKIKPLKDITDDTSVINPKSSDLNQCPLCRQLFVKNHKCNENWHVCTVCGLSLEKKQKEIIHGNRKYFTFGRSKKYYKIINTLICHQCACNIIREMKSK